MLTLIDSIFFFFSKPVFIVGGRLGVNEKELERFLKFLVVGTVGFAVDFGTLNLLKLVFGFQLLVANTISFSLAVLSNFTWNRLWTYPDSRSKPASWATTSPRRLRPSWFSFGTFLSTATGPTTTSESRARGEDAAGWN
jgi:hypothetical protein